MNNDIAPCPFCGGEAHVFSTGRAFPRKYFRIICKRNCCMQSKLYKSKDDAVKAWNRRVCNG